MMINLTRIYLLISWQIKNNSMKRLIFLLPVLLALPAAAQRFPAGDVPEQKNYVYVDTVTYRLRCIFRKVTVRGLW